MAKPARPFTGIVLVLVLLLLFSQGVLAQETQSCGTDSGEGCAPASKRVDRYEPVFVDANTVSHPFFPAGMISKTLLLGHVDGQPLRVEYTLLPQPRIIQWNGQEIHAVEVQYLAHKNGSIAEVALDWYAQDNRGAVWYLGEDVFNYEDGVVANREGTWMAGRNGPAAMIMPADPQAGDVYRPENIPNMVFEEVTVAAIGITITSPSGAVQQAIIVDELHMDGAVSRKTFAAGYGEYVTMNHNELEAVTLALPTDMASTPLPTELTILTQGAAVVDSAAAAGEWQTVTTTLARMVDAWRMTQAQSVPFLLAAQMDTALAQLTASVDLRQDLDARRSANQVALAALDLRLLYEPLADNELERFALWTRQVVADSAAGNEAAVLSDITTLEWILPRLSPTLDKASAARIQATLRSLRSAAGDADFGATGEAAANLLAMLGDIR